MPLMLTGSMPGVLGGVSKKDHKEVVKMPNARNRSFALRFRTDRAPAIAPYCAHLGGLVDSRYGKGRSLAISEK
jgi:hypothetical protein